MSFDLPGTDIAGHIPRFLSVARDATRIIECGVRSGNSTRVFLHGLPYDGHLWSIDPVRYPALPEDPRWTFLLGDDLDPDVLALLPTEVDVVFIDSSVPYDHKLAELHEYVPRLRPGGLLFVHDTEAHYIAAALDAYCADTGTEWMDDPVSHGLGIITRA